MPFDVLFWLVGCHDLAHEVGFHVLPLVVEKSFVYVISRDSLVHYLDRITCFGVRLKLPIAFMEHVLAVAAYVDEAVLAEVARGIIAEGRYVEGVFSVVGGWQVLDVESCGFIAFERVDGVDAIGCVVALCLRFRC